jgi:hypothetical protein
LALRNPNLTPKPQAKCSGSAPALAQTVPGGRADRSDDDLPVRLSPMTFWFVGMQSDRILLILMPATTHFGANTWRTAAAIDERLMKGFSRDQLF